MMPIPDQWILLLALLFPATAFIMGMKIDKMLDIHAADSYGWTSTGIIFAGCALGILLLILNA